MERCRSEPIFRMWRGVPNGSCEETSWRSWPKRGEKKKNGIGRKVRGRRDVSWRLARNDAGRPTVKPSFRICPLSLSPSCFNVFQSLYLPFQPIYVIRSFWLMKHSMTWHDGCQMSDDVSINALVSIKCTCVSVIQNQLVHVLVLLMPIFPSSMSVDIGGGHILGCQVKCTTSHGAYSYF